MLDPDFSDRTYTAEVVRCKEDAADVFRKILRLVIDTTVVNQDGDQPKRPVKLCHGFLPSASAFHRSFRSVIDGDGQEIPIPRRKIVKGQEVNLYDVFVAQRHGHVVIAVPFHDLAEDFFVRVDRALGGTSSSYQKLDITRMVIRLGSAGATNVPNSPVGENTQLSVTRCHLSYVDQVQRTSNVQQICMTGANLGASVEYRALVAPVLNPKAASLTVTPIVLGFVLSANGVRKSGATTDRHGNFKIWVAPGLRRLIRLFDLLDTLETMKDVALTTDNIPILQSKTIREAEA